VRRRHAYVLIFAIPAVLAAAVGAALVTGAVAGSLWLYVFGDNPWPAAAQTGLAATFLVATAAFAAALLTLAYRTGAGEEARPSLNTAHVALAVGSTVLLAIFIGMRVTGTRIGGPTDGELCAGYCLSQGFSGSGLPPRNSGDTTCTCFGDGGRTIAVSEEVWKSEGRK
jgi:hypothetical protein